MEAVNFALQLPLCGAHDDSERYSANVQALLTEIASHEFDHAAYFHTKSGPLTFSQPAVRLPLLPGLLATALCRHRRSMQSQPVLCEEAASLHKAFAQTGSVTI